MCKMFLHYIIKCLRWFSPSKHSFAHIFSIESRQMGTFSSASLHLGTILMVTMDKIHISYSKSSLTQVLSAFLLMFSCHKNTSNL